MLATGMDAPGSCVFLCSGDLDHTVSLTPVVAPYAACSTGEVPASWRSRATLTAAFKDIRCGTELRGHGTAGGGLAQRVSSSWLAAVGESPAARATRWEAWWPGWI